MEKVIVGAVMVVLFIGMLLGIYWGFWHLWLWVLPQVYPNGPEGLLRPGYWLFVGCAFLVSWIGRSVFGGSSSKK